MTCCAAEADEHRLALCLMKSNPARICVPVCVQRASELEPAFRRAAETGDIVELRLDYLDQNECGSALSFLRGYLECDQTPTVLTFRSTEQGGQTSTDSGGRYRLWTSLAGVSTSALLDWELDLALRFAAEQPSGESPIDWSRVICSYHDFRGLPSDLVQVYERMAATPARILKIAVQADDATDCLPVFQLLERAQSEGRDLIAIAMGQAGIMTRILGPSRGSFLTYASSDEESSTAPGQLTARELHEVYRIDRIDSQTEVVGLMGMPVRHSLSPQIHNAAFATAGENAVYLPFEVHDADQFMRRMSHPRSRELEWNLRGLSVTAPHKSVVMSSLDWIEPAAKAIGAVNTIVVRDSELHGYNTDAAGFVGPLKHEFGSLQEARCGIIGAGGAARAALSALRSEGADVALFVRNSRKNQTVAAELEVECLDVSGASFAGFDIVVNATPLGTRGVSERETVAIAEQLRGVRLAYDLVYNPLETRFLREARQAGCETLGGIEMLLAQAVEQFKIWIGREPDLEVMRAAATSALGK